MRTVVGILAMCLTASTVAAQSTKHDWVLGLQGAWKYLGGYVFVNVDEDGRAFQCRIDRDMNIYFSTAELAVDGAVSWELPRFFSIYGKELVPSGQIWSNAKIDLRGRIMFMDTAGSVNQAAERLEFDKVPELPTICSHYLALAFE